MFCDDTYPLMIQRPEAVPCGYYMYVVTKTKNEFGGGNFSESRSFQQHAQTTSDGHRDHKKLFGPVSFFHFLHMM